jgi:non-specific serine/threonine protein kinase
VAEEQGDHWQARSHFEAALAIRRKAGDRPGVAASLGALSIAARLGGDLRRAVALAEEAVALTRGLADPAGLAYRLYVLCLAAVAGGDLDRAREAGLEAVALERELGTEENVARRLEGLAAVVHETGRPGAAAGAARLLGAAAALREAIAAPPRNPQGHRDGVEAVRARLTPAAFARAWAEGGALAPEGAVADALPPPLPNGRANGHPPASPPGGRLTAREREVAALVAEGLSNRELAAQLVVTVRTAENHVQRLLDKLGLGSRARLALWARAHLPPEGSPEATPADTRGNGLSSTLE